MAFPEVQRFIYEINPLEEVVCQLRFPSILKIDTGIPADFQEQIRAKYPLYKVTPAGSLFPGLPSELATKLAMGNPAFSGQNAHVFSSKDERWSISLARDYLALTCSRYERWEQFKEHLKGPLAALCDLYSPAFFSRIGLRYRDVIRRSVLGLDQTSWADLLNPWISGCFASKEVADDIEMFSSHVMIRIPDKDSKLFVQHGLALTGPRGERCYLIDADFSTVQQTEPAHATDRLDSLNSQARRFFRWCITDRLHEAMRPRPL